MKKRTALCMAALLAVSAMFTAIPAAAEEETYKMVMQVINQS